MEGTGTTIQLAGAASQVRAATAAIPLLAIPRAGRLTPCPTGAALNTQGTCKENNP